MSRCSWTSVVPRSSGRTRPVTVWTQSIRRQLQPRKPRNAHPHPPLFDLQHLVDPTLQLLVHDDGLHEPPELLPPELLPPLELLPPELLPPLELPPPTHIALKHDSPVLQAKQGTPPEPQAFGSDVPIWQAPLLSQHPAQHAEHPPVHAPSPPPPPSSPPLLLLLDDAVPSSPPDELLPPLLLPPLDDVYEPLLPPPPPSSPESAPLPELACPPLELADTLPSPEPVKPTSASVACPAAHPSTKASESGATPLGRKRIKELLGGTAPRPFQDTRVAEGSNVREGM